MYRMVKALHSNSLISQTQHAVYTTYSREFRNASIFISHKIQLGCSCTVGQSTGHQWVNKQVSLQVRWKSVEFIRHRQMMSRIS